ncbi:MAG: AAA family ATPase [Lachnospiraceae bacterium]|nr:AAA family ATPase [Lachnospiraceae bacterium]
MKGDTVYLRREAVTEKLEKARSVPLLAVTGYAGCGKTTAVRSFLDGTGVRQVYVRCHEAVGVAPEEYFFYLIVEALGKQSPETAAKLEEIGLPQDSIRISRALHALEKMGTEETFLVVDDFHRLESESIDRILNRLTEEELPWLHIAVISRRRPALRISELVFKGRAVEVEASEFELSYEETVAYLDAVGFSGSNEQRRSIIDLSRGWLPAVITLTQAVKEGTDVKEVLARLLRSVFLDSYDADTQRILLSLSPFDEIDPDQLIYVFQAPDMLSRMETLRSENPFILRKDSGAFVLAPPYRAMLAEQQRMRGIDTTDVMQRAAEWFSVHSEQSMAIKFWHLLREYGFVLHDLEQSNSSKMSAFDMDLVDQAFSSVDDEKMYQYPIATLKYIFYHARYGDMRVAQATILRFYRIFSVREHPVYPRRRLWAELYLICFVVCYGNLPYMLYFTRRAHDLLDGQTSLIFNPDYVTTFGFPHFSGAFFSGRGKYRETVETLADYFPYHVENTGGMGTGFEYLIGAEYGLETVNLREVENLALKAIFKAATRHQACIIVGAKMTIARLMVLEGRTEEVEGILSELADLKKTKRDVANQDVIDNAIGCLQSLLGRVDQIPAWIRNTDVILSRTRFQGAGFSFIVYGRSLLLEGEYLRFDALHEGIRRRLVDCRCQLGLIHHQIHRAVASFHLFGKEAGARELQAAFDMALADGILMPFIEDYGMLRPLLEHGGLTIPADVRERLTELGRRWVSHLPSHETRERADSLLSAREVEVLALIEKGLSSAAIGDTLYISQHTVKRHLQNIYTKLGVNNKVAAIRKFKGEI